MCGIVGYTGPKKVIPVILEGLKRLEYRGYDSAGIVYLEEGELTKFRCEGKLSNLENLVEDVYMSPVHIGLGHTRWATHGRPSEQNAHPHRAGRTVVVHNGIIENYLAIKQALIDAGREFTSETDTEVIAQLIDRRLNDGLDPADAIRTACK